MPASVCYPLISQERDFFKCIKRVESYANRSIAIISDVIGKEIFTNRSAGIFLA